MKKWSNICKMNMLFMMITMLFSTAVMANQNQTQEMNKF